MLIDLRKDIELAADQEKSVFLQRFFKTGKGQYGEGDIFVGMTVPQSRKIAKKYQDLDFTDIETLLSSKIHEERLIALVILVMQFEKGDEARKKTIYEFYLKHAKKINNWDLVDLSADKIVGEYLYSHSLRHLRTDPESRQIDSGFREEDVLEKLAKSDDLWEKRIAMVACFAFIKNGYLGPSYTIADILLQDKHDLIQKAVGWMLRETGKRVSETELEMYLKTRYKTMPRTMLRYAIERFSSERRKEYLQGSV